MKNLILFPMLVLLVFSCQNSFDDLPETELEKLENEILHTVNLRSNNFDSLFSEKIKDLYDYLEEENENTGGDLFYFLDTNQLDYFSAMSVAEDNNYLDTSLVFGLANEVEQAMNNLDIETVESLIDSFILSNNLSTFLSSGSGGSSERPCFWCVRDKVVNRSTEHLGYCWCRFDTYIFWIRIGRRHDACPC